jgi:MFS family permease
MCGIAIASFAGSVGATPILAAQVIIFAVGVVGFFRIPRSAPASATGTSLVAELRRSIAEGYRVVVADSATRVTVLQNLAMSVFFMGAFIVTVPLVVREVYGGSSAELGWTNGAFSLGLISMVAVLSRRGDLAKPGRALISAQAVGAIALSCAGLGFVFPVFVGLIFTWGALGGVAMSMSRTIVQERAPADSRGRVLSFYTLTLMGAGPVGALFNGYLSAWVGPGATLVVVSGLMFLTMVGVALTSHLWVLKNQVAAA